jgi:hypothetical protein
MSADILARYPSSLTERNVVGQTPLHLSCGWPLGTKLLLDAGPQDIVDVMDDFGWPTLVYACHFSCLECLELLLEADCSPFPLIPCEEPSSNLECSSQALRKGSWDTGRRLIQSLSERQESLKALALDNLPYEEIQKLNLCDGKILDERSHYVYAALKASRVSIPEALAVPFAQTSVYHPWYLSPAWAELFYNTGFHDVDIFNEEGLNPLMLSSYSFYDDHDADYPFGLGSWLLSRGANLYATPKYHRKALSILILRPPIISLPGWGKLSVMALSLIAALSLIPRFAVVLSFSVRSPDSTTVFAVAQAEAVFQPQ